ncbi:MAG: hypothetical protein J0M12_17010 [Deltaproteobacteria bacterium]|nr:hypothetical protein [Deltaproteobacteria bacterium]
MTAAVDSALSERAKEIVANIKRWDRQDIMELHGLLMELRKIVALFDQDPAWYISREQVPSVPLPPELPIDSIWGCDLHGICLVKNEHEFVFKARSTADLAPHIHFDPSVGVNPLEVLRAADKKRITIQLSQREYAGLQRAMLQDEEPKVASWVRELILREIKGRGIKF